MSQSTLTRVALAAVLMFGLAPTAMAQKIGYVNALKVLDQAPQAASARETLQKEFAERDRQLVAAQRDLKSMQDKLEKDAAVMSEGERSKLQRDLIAKQRDLQRDQDEFREDVNLRRNEEFGKIQKDIVGAIQAVAKEEGYDLVLSEGVAFASEQVDMTNAVIERLKKGP